MVFWGVTGLKSQELGYLLFHYLNLEKHIFCVEYLMNIFKQIIMVEDLNLEIKMQ